MTPSSLGLVLPVVATALVPLLATLHMFSPAADRARLRAGKPLAQGLPGGVLAFWLSLGLCVAGFVAVGAFRPSLHVVAGVTVLAIGTGLALRWGPVAGTVGTLRAAPSWPAQIRNSP